ncbi:hypothetical protein RHMOL_Rhmol04G0054500 [Rhododendron molle]|uniref:Uncharacterized protein n=1 Tax=Rhododendron molle TaxID=49168 RepID=A0ACC0NZP4_RHOML|nr:hypothetical protein RHMOL_Rhmol04G0054500 [Rhododendron molle]
MSEESKVHHHHHHHQQPEQPPPPPPQYGTFQGVQNYPPQPVIGFPQPVAPPGSAEPPQYYGQGYQAVPGVIVVMWWVAAVAALVVVAWWWLLLSSGGGAVVAVLIGQKLFANHSFFIDLGYAVAEGRPVRERRLPCCGIGCGWFLFIIGFFLAAIPWYVGAIILLCVRSVDYREKPGYIACTVAVSSSYLLFLFNFQSLHTLSHFPSN